MTKKIKIPYFPKAWKYETPLNFGAAIYLAYVGHPGWSCVLILLSVIILTTNYVTEINLTEKKYDDYLLFLAIRINPETKKFKSVDRIVVTKRNNSQMLNYKWRSRQMNWADYTASLITDNGTLDLLTRTSKQELLSELKEFTEFLNVGVEDQTSREHFWIDLTRV